MGIDLRTGAVIAGGIGGAYLSDITENPLSGLLSTGVGMGMGAFMSLPEYSLKELSKVNVGPSVSSDYLLNKQQSAEAGYSVEAFNRRLDSFFSRTSTPLDARVKPLEDSLNNRRSSLSSSLIERQIRARSKAEGTYNRELGRINSVFDKKVTDLQQVHNNILDSKREKYSLLEKSKEAAYYNRMTTREEKSVSSWLNTPQGKKELGVYDKWIERQSQKRTHLASLDIYDARNALFKEYTNRNPKAFVPIKKRQEYYSKRLHADKKDLFNPWFRDYKQSNQEDLTQISQRNSAALESFSTANNKARQESLEALKIQYNTRLAGIDNWVSSSQTEQTRSQNRLLEKHTKRIEKVTEKFNREESVYGSIRNLLKTNGINVPDSRAEIVQTIKGLNDDSLLKNIDVILKNNDVNFINQSQLKVKKWKNQYKHTNNKDLAGLTDWFKNQLGHNALDAEEKAKMFLNRAGEGAIHLKNSNISFIDKLNGERVTVPLTSYSENGTRYHNMGNGNYSVANQFNPYSAAYVDGLEVNIDGTKRLVTAQDVLKGSDAETMLKYLPENKPISSVLPKIESLFHYNSQEAGVVSSDINSDIFKNNQNMVDLGTTLRYDQYGEIDKEYPLRKLNQTSTKDLASERQRTMFKLANELTPEQAAHLMDGISLGNLTSVNTKGYYSIAALAPNERGETSVGNRGTKIINKNENTKLLENLIGEDRFNNQFSSSQVLNRVDVKDDKLFNSVVTSLYGNDHVLGDGAGFFNMGDVDSLRIKDRSIIKIPLSNNMAIANQDLLLGLTSSEGLSEYLKINPINIGNEALAYNQNLGEIGLNKAYSSGSIVDGFMTESDIRLVVDSEFNPGQERNMKFYSTGTKSLNTGIDQARFNILSEIGLAVNDRRLNLGKNGELTYEGVHYKNRQDFLGKIGSVVQEKIENKTFVQNTLISRASDTGANTIMDMVRTGAKGNKIYDLLMGQNKDSKISAMTAALLSEHKAAVDLSVTVGTGIQKGIDSGNLPKAFRQDFLYHFNADNFIQSKNKGEFLDRAYNLVASSGVVDNYLSGQSLAVGSFNKGASIVGKDKNAKMSWTAINNLKASGLSTEDLNVFGLKNESALYELRSMSDERKVSNKSINSIIEGKEARFLNIINGNNAPEKRFELLKSSFGRSADILADNPFITYNLAFSNNEVKSINFSKITTDRSGLFEKADIKMLKDLEKKKLDIVVADLAYKDSTTVADRSSAQKVLEGKLNEYDNLSKKMLSGSNNLLKESLSLYSEKSSVMQVKYIGGNADKFATDKFKVNEHVMFISEEEAQEKAKKLGVTLDWETTQYDNIKKPVYKRGNDIIPLASMVTREPAQGPLSSDLISWHVDTSIAKGNQGNTFISLSNSIYHNGMFGDGDQDTVQTLLGDFQNKSQFDRIEGSRKPIRQSFFDMEDIITSMKIKGKNTSMKTIADFATDSEYAAYRVSGGLKGRNRKTLAAPATGLAVSYSKALELEIGHLGSNSKELTQGRVMIHQLVENLLKSAHLDTDSFQLVNEQDVERLTRMRNGFLGKKGYEGITSKEYEAELRKTLPSFLGINSIDTSTATGVKTKEQATGILNNIISGELNHAVNIGDNPFTPLDLNEKRFSKTSGEFIDTLNNIVKESGITSMDYEDGVKHLKKASGQIALGTYDYLLDLAKSNKGVIGGGLAAMAGIALLGREQPNFSDSRSAARQHGASMLRSPGTYDETSQNNTPMAIETNPNRAGYILPKTFGAKGIKIGGDFINSGNEMYNEYNSLLDTENVQDQISNMAYSVFGDGIRSARLQTN